jgi:hypothetical protein
MFNKAKCLLAMLAGLSLLLSACRSAAPEATTPTTDPNAVFTAAASTANAEMTRIAASTPSPAPATATSTTQPPTATVSPTAAATTPATTTVLTAAPGADKAQWVADVTVPDGANYQPNATFVKTWRLQNTGSSTWTPTYSLVFVSGAPMTQTTKVPINQEVGPGQTVDVSVNMTAPSDPGNYKGFWKVANDQGAAFEVAIWVDINVSGTPGAATATGTTGTPAATSTGATATTAATSAAGNTVTGVTFSINTAAYEGACPYVFIFPAEVTLNRAATITYQLEAGTEVSGFQFNLPSPTTVSLQAGTHNIAYQLEFSQSVTGWVRFHVTAPNDVSSAQVPFSLTCE